MASNSPCKSRGMKRPLEATEQQDRTSPMTIVLTGGPCSGKSSVLALIRDRLSKRGLQVVTVPEYATHFFANSDGFQVEWVGTEKEKGVQRTFLKFQMMQEDMFKDFASLNSKPSVMLLDRGALDQKVFTSSDEIWKSALTACGVTEEQLLDRYDMVLHLGTCAKVGEYEWGPGSNNPGRYHSPDEAAETDKKCEEVYKGHKQHRMVPHCGKFEDKVERVMGYLEDALAVDGLVGKRGRTAVTVNGAIPDEVLANAQAYVITSAYLDTTMQLSVRRRLRVPVEGWKEGLKEGATTMTPVKKSCHADLEQVFEERRSIPDEQFLARRVISEVAYNTAVQIAPQAQVDKHVLSFQGSNGQHYELFYFQDGRKRQLLLDSTIGAGLPKWLSAVSELRAHPSAETTKNDNISSARPRLLRKHSTVEAAEAHALGYSGC